MLVIRGNNVFPSTIEGMLREFVEVAEFVIRRANGRPAAELVLEVEPRPSVDHAGLAQRIVSAIRDRLHFRAQVSIVPPGSLPRSEFKTRRVIHEP